MNELKRVSNDFEMEITDPKKEIPVEVYFRCFVTKSASFYPMDCSGSIYKGLSLSQFKEEQKKEYEKQYVKVEIVDVFVEL